MDAHPHPHPLPGRPRMRPQRPLHLDRRIHTGPRRGEHRENPIALAGDFLAAMRGQGRPDQPVMIGQHPRPRVPQPRRHRGGTLDVGEQERERLRGHSPTLPIEVDANRTGQKATGLLPSGANIIRPPLDAEPGAATPPISAPPAAMLPGEPDPARRRRRAIATAVAAARNPRAQRHWYRVQRRPQLLQAPSTPLMDSQNCRLWRNPPDSRSSRTPVPNESSLCQGVAAVFLAACQMVFERCGFTSGAGARGLPAGEDGRRLGAPPGRSSSLRCGRSTWTCGLAGGRVAAAGECPALPWLRAVVVGWWAGPGVACPKSWRSG